MVSQSLLKLSVLLIFVCFASGCGSAAKTKIVNANTLPGHRFDKYKTITVETPKVQRPQNGRVIYLGDEGSSNIGPGEVRFAFE